MKKIFSIILMAGILWGPTEGMASAVDVQQPMGDIKLKPPKDKPGSVKPAAPSPETKPGASTKPDKQLEEFCQNACTSASCTDPTFHNICSIKCPQDGPGAIGAAGRSCDRGWKAKTEGKLKNKKVPNRQGKMVDVTLDTWADSNAVRSACSKSAKCNSNKDIKTACHTAFMKLPVDEAEKAAKFMAPDCLPVDEAKKLEAQKKPAAPSHKGASEEDIRNTSEGRYEGSMFCLDCDAGTCKAEAWGEACKKKCKADLISVCLKELKKVQDSGQFLLPSYQRILSGKCDSKNCKNPDTKAACQATYQELKDVAEDNAGNKKMAEALKEWNSKIKKCLDAK